MATNSSITHPASTDKRQHPGNGATPTYPPQVRLTADAITEFTDQVVARGTRGRVLTISQRGMLVDFGLAAVCVLPAGSSLVEFVREEGAA